LIQVPPVFSTRFLLLPTQQGTYGVPAGHIAVVRCITVWNTSATATGWVTVAVNTSTQILSASLPTNTRVAAENHAIVWDVRIVLAAAETFTILRSSADVHAQASGYLFPA